MATAAQEHVAAGAVKWDEKRPDWFRQIDKQKLSIQSTINCICGQLTGGYITGLTELGLQDGGATEHGFVGQDIELVPLWIEEIDKRLAAEPERELVLA